MSCFTVAVRTFSPLFSETLNSWAKWHYSEFMTTISINLWLQFSLHRQIHLCIHSHFCGSRSWGPCTPRCVACAWRMPNVLMLISTPMLTVMLAVWINTRQRAAAVQHCSSAANAAVMHKQHIWCATGLIQRVVFVDEVAENMYTEYMTHVGTFNLYTS